MAKPYIINVLDIGSSSIKLASILKKPGEDKFEVLAYAQEFSSGVRRGVVIDTVKVSEIISFLVKKVEEESGKKIKDIYVSVGGSHLFSALSKGLVSVSRADKKISEEDVERALQAAETISLPPNQEVIGVFPKEFIIDGQRGIKEAVGLEGVRLEVEALVLGGFSPYLRNSNKCFEDCGLNVNYLLPDFLASAKAVLTSREKELGSCVLDIGAGTTGMAVFEEESLIHGAVFPIGSAHITNDIAICLKTDIDTAEKLKIEFGSCRDFSSTKKNRISEKKIKIEGEEPFIFSKKNLVDIIEARISQIFDQVNKELKKISKYNQLPGGVILTGGGAKIPGIKDLAKRKIKLPCRIAEPVGFNNFDDPSFSTLCGLALEAAEMEEKENSLKKSGSGFISFLKRIFNYFFKHFIP